MKLQPDAAERVGRLLNGEAVDGITLGMLAHAVATNPELARFYAELLRAELDAPNPLLMYIRGNPK